MPVRYSNYAFKEIQRFDQWWIWTILALVTLIPVYGIYQQIILGIPFGDHPASDMGLLIILIGVLMLDVLFFTMKLSTHINAEHIEMRYFPLVKKRVKWTEVAHADVVDYGFVGYGIRLFTRYGTVYNVKGRKGLAIELKNGKKFLIGTQRAHDLIQLLSSRQLETSQNS